MKNNRIDVKATEMKDVPEALQKSLAYLIYNAHQQGVRHIGESITLMVPDLACGPSDGQMVELSGYEVKISKERQ